LSILSSKVYPLKASSTSFETSTLEQVYGAIAYYLGHRSEIDGYLEQSEAEFDELFRRVREENPLLYQKLDEARRQTADRSDAPRPFGLVAGDFVVPDDFGKPLAEEILREFEG
jgi:hypothetical protein